MEFSWKTRGGADPHDKQKIFVHVMTGDGPIGERIVSAILDGVDGNNYAVWTCRDPQSVFTAYDSAELSQMNLFVPVITQEYLECASKTKFSFADLKQKTGLHLLPVITEGDLIPKFNTAFGSLHAVCMSKPDWAAELSRLLSELLISGKLTHEILRHAFSRKLFLSYRKVDKKNALAIMRKVHDTQNAAAAEIWYDAFLDPGEVFSDTIRNSMQQSSAILLSVTPRLLEPGLDGGVNYVQAEEYPDACRMNKTVLPIEAVPTERPALEAAFLEIPPCIDLNDVGGIDRALGSIPDMNFDEKQRGPYATYLLGMAFLNGLRVEKDPERARVLLAEAADGGIWQAAEELSRMYVLGIGVIPDKLEGIRWRQRAFVIVENMDNGIEKIETMRRLLFEYREGRISIGKDTEEEAAYSRRMLDAAEACPADGDADAQRILLLKAEACCGMGNLENGDLLPDQNAEENVKYAVANLNAAAACLDAYKLDRKADFLRVAASMNSLYCSCMRKIDKKREAIDYAQRAVQYQGILITNYDSSYEARQQYATYLMNLGGCRFNILLPELQKHIVDTEEYLSPAREPIEKAIKEYEQLYREKRDLICGLELIDGYINLTLANPDTKKTLRLLKDSMEKLKKLEGDYPYSTEILKKERDLAGKINQIQTSRVISYTFLAGIGLSLLYLLLKCVFKVF